MFESIFYMKKQIPEKLTVYGFLEEDGKYRFGRKGNRRTICII